MSKPFPQRAVTIAAASMIIACLLAGVWFANWMPEGVDPENDPPTKPSPTNNEPSVEAPQQPPKTDSSEKPLVAEKPGESTPPPQPIVDYISLKAEELDFDRRKVVDFVENQIAHEDYPGMLRGDVGALWSAAANSIDRTLLLASLLRACDEEVRFARGENEVHLQVKTENGWQNVASQIATGNGELWSETTPPEEDIHKLRIDVERQTGDRVETQSATFSTAELIGDPLVLSFTEQSYRLTKASDPTGGTSATASLADTDSLTLVFRYTRPGDKEILFRREIFNGGYESYHKLADPRNVHVIVALPCLLRKSVLDRETDSLAVLAKRFGKRGSDVAHSYLLAMTHMAKSDTALDEFRGHFKVDAYFTSPRVIIGSTIYQGEDELAGRTLDLRKNDIHVVGDEPTRASFCITRSMFEGALESQVLHDAMGGSVTSAFEVFRQHLAPFKASTPERIDSYRDILQRFAAETHANARLKIETHNKQSVEFERQATGELRCDFVSSELKGKLAASELPFTNLRADRFDASTIDVAAVELESLLGPIAGADAAYQPVVEITDAPSDLIRPGVRFFNRSLPALFVNPHTRFDYEILEETSDGGIVYESIDEWDGRNYTIEPQVHRFKLSKEVVEETSLITSWPSQENYDKGAQHLMFSRKMYRELVEQGFTNVRYLSFDGTVSKSFKLYNVQQAEVNLSLNGRAQKTPLIWVAGDYLENDKPKSTWFWTKTIDDLTGPRAVAKNKWVILDNPKYPLVVAPATAIYTAIQGKVISSVTKRGLANASVTIVGTRAQGDSWADGQFRLPVIKQRLGKFTVQIACQGFQPLETEVDFADERSFPLVFELTPVPKPESMLWVGRKNAGEELSKIENPRIRDLVEQAISDNPNLCAIVPRKGVNFGAGSSHAWLLLDNETFHITPVSEDGLHGVAGNIAVHAIGENPQGSAVSAYAGAMSSWYAYSAGKLDWLAAVMSGAPIEDLGHTHAMQSAMDFLEGMQPEGFFAETASSAAGVNMDAFTAGFLAGLQFFENNPAYRGQ